MLDIETEKMQEVLKNYYKNVSLGQDKRAKEDLNSLNNLRLNNVINSELKRIFYDQVDIPALASGGRRDTFFARNDVDYLLVRGIADLDLGSTVSLEKAGGKEKVITREAMSWQQIFSAVQGTLDGLEVLNNFPQEIYLGENESLQIGITGNINAGFIWLHGATLKSQVDINIADVKEEISHTLPRTQLVPLLYTFPTAIGDAVNPNGGVEIMSQKNNASVLLTHVSITDQACRISLYDEGKNLQICDRVEAVGVASDFLNRFTTFYALPYPHLLYRGDRLKLRAVNGTDRSADFVPVDTLQHLTFRGYTI